MSQDTAPHAWHKQRAESDRPDLFWQCFEQLASTHAAAFKLVVEHLPKNGAARLRGVSRAMRQAVNRTVTTVVCSAPLAPFGSLDLALRFPEASRLIVQLYQLAATEVAMIFSHLCTSSPALLSKIQSLRMELHSSTVDSGSVARSVAELLSRCALSYPHPWWHNELRAVL
jgi:hypothetical protein